jgi:hypothetical protein
MKFKVVQHCESPNCAICPNVIGNVYTVRQTTTRFGENYFEVPYLNNDGKENFTWIKSDHCEIVEGENDMLSNGKTVPTVEPLEKIPTDVFHKDFETAVGATLGIIVRGYNKMVDHINKLENRGTELFIKVNEGMFKD